MHGSVQRRLRRRHLLMVTSVVILAAAGSVTIPARSIPGAAVSGARAGVENAVAAGSSPSVPDVRWSLIGDASGLHVLVAPGTSGTAWTDVASLGEPGIDTDRWIGHGCVTGDGRTLVVAYAPRSATNDSTLFDSGAAVATVDLLSGHARRLPLTSTLAYFSPGCGAGTEVVISRFDASAATSRLERIDAITHRVAAELDIPGQLTSAIPWGDDIAAADDGAVVLVDRNGVRRVLTATSSVPSHLTPDRHGGIVFMERADDRMRIRRIGSGRGATSELLATADVGAAGISRAADGAVVITGHPEVVGTLPDGIELAPGSHPDADVSTGAGAVTELLAQGVRDSAPIPAGQVTRPLAIRTLELDTGRTEVHQPVLLTRLTLLESPPDRALRRSAGWLRTAGDPAAPVETGRTCAVARNDPRNQAMQPKPRQVEWAVDQAVRGVLTVPRPANWKNLGMPAYTPQGLFPGLALAGGGTVPAQIVLGIAAQESNLWQAPGHVVPGVTGNPLIGNYYGLDLYDGNASNDWDIDFAAADCGYGVMQITDGMRLAGREGGAPPALPAASQRAVALDFATNVAAGVRIIQSKWNQVRAAGLVLNDGDPRAIENWFFAVWAYNSGFHPRSEAAANAGAWGLGWANNPANPKYDPNRSPFLEKTYADAAHPEKWPYPEKVMGWAGHPVEVLESPGVLVAGYRAAWWNAGPQSATQYRETVKPPLHQFCTADNACVPGARYVPNSGEVVGEPAGPCGHRNGVGLYDLKCWIHTSSSWKNDCAALQCGNELLRFSPGYEYQADGTAYAPACSISAELPADALVIDDQPDSVPAVRPGCLRSFTNHGTFGLSFGADSAGRFPSKVDLHQLGGGFASHFWFTHTRTADVRGGSMNITGTWTLDRTLHQWARVFVHLPDHGAHTQQAQYEVDLGTGTRRRVVLQRVQRNAWVSIGVFPFSGTPRVRLRSSTLESDAGDGGVQSVENEDVAWDAVAVQPLAAAPGQIVVSMGDSYSSGEGASTDLQGTGYYRESDNNGPDPDARNACHRSPETWSRRLVIKGSPMTIGARSDAHTSGVEHSLIACSGAQTENILPQFTNGGSPARNAFGDAADGRFGELSQLDRGFVDQDTTLVTLSIGGNDTGFSEVLKTCAAKILVTCTDAPLPGSTRPMREEVPDRITRLVRPSVVSVLMAIHQRAPRARILLMGYPHLFTPNMPCDAIVGAADTAWLAEMSDLLDRTLGSAVTDANIAAATTFAWFSDPRTVFTGHERCSGDPALNGVVVTKSPGEPRRSEPGSELVSQQSFHPNAAGYALYARAANQTLGQMGLG